MSAIYPIPYLTPRPTTISRSRLAVAAFVLGGYAAGAMLLSVLAVTFPLMNAPASWEFIAAAFGFSMFGAWVMSIVLAAAAAAFGRGADRSPAGWGLVLDVAAACLAVLFVAVA